MERTPASELLELLARSRPAWHAEAACRDEDTAIFFRDSRRGATLDAQWICTTCPAREPCLAWAMEHAEAGVWGGTTEADPAGHGGGATGAGVGEPMSTPVSTLVNARAPTSTYETGLVPGCRPR